MPQATRPPAHEHVYAGLRPRHNRFSRQVVLVEESGIRMAQQYVVLRQNPVYRL